MRIIDTVGQFTIGKLKEGYVVINNEGDYHNHSHFECEQGARECIKLINKGLQPRQCYYQKAVKRLIGEERYSELVETGKDRYININKGVRK